MEVGDRVLVMPSLGENVAIPLNDVSIGDSVILYNLKDETRIAVPTLSLSIGSYVFNTPSFNFAGFNWSIDFNFELIPLNLFFTGEYTDHDFSARSGQPGYDSMKYGDTPLTTSGGCLKSRTIGVKYGGDWAYNFADGHYRPGETPGTADALTIEIKLIPPARIEWWVHSGPSPNYGGGMWFYFRGTLLGLFTVPDGDPNYLAGHGYIDL